MKKLLLTLMTVVLLLGTAFPKTTIYAEDDDGITWVESDLGIEDENGENSGDGDPDLGYEAGGVKKGGTITPTGSSNNNSNNQNEPDLGYEVGSLKKGGTITKVDSTSGSDSSNQAAEEAARLEAEEKARKEAEEAARLEAERLAREEAERLRREKEEAEAREKLNIKGNNVTPNVTLEDAQRNSSICKGNIGCGDVYNGTQKGKADLSGGAVDETYNTTEIENLVFDKLNTMRVEMGLLPLTKSDENSRDWAQVMATTGLFEHAQLSPTSRYSNEYATNHSMVSENIAIAILPKAATAEQIADKLTEMWNNSPGHYNNRTNKCQYSEKVDGGCVYDIAVVRSAAGAYWAVERIGY